MNLKKKNAGFARPSNMFCGAAGLRLPDRKSQAVRKSQASRTAAAVLVGRCFVATGGANGSVRGTATLVFVVLSLCRVRQSEALVRPGECIVNGDCQSDPERLHGVQDWEGYVTHASGHSPSRYGRPPTCGWNACASCAARALRPACAPGGVRALISGRAGLDATRGPPIFTGPAVTIRVSARTRCANSALARVGLLIAARCAWRTTVSEC